MSVGQELLAVPFPEMIQKMGARDSANFNCHGVYEQTLDTDNNATIIVSELPVRERVKKYKQHLKSMLPGATGPNAGNVKDFKENNTDTTVRFTITLSPEGLEAVKKNPSDILKVQARDQYINDEYASP